MYDYVRILPGQPYSGLLIADIWGPCSGPQITMKINILNIYPLTATTQMQLSTVYRGYPAPQGPHRGPTGTIQPHRDYPAPQGLSSPKNKHLQDQTYNKYQYIYTNIYIYI
jgi:hypothetical protein